MAEIRHVTLPVLTAEEQARRERMAAAYRTRAAAEVAEAIATVRCPRCKAEPGQPCVWRVRHSEVVHAPRLNRALVRGGAA